MRASIVTFYTERCKTFLSSFIFHCYLFNIGRGNVYKEQDLAAVLNEKKIAGAYLDVFSIEPLSEKSSLWEMDNVLIQPHISAASPLYMQLFVEELAEKIRDFKKNIPS